MENQKITISGKEKLQTAHTLLSIFFQKETQFAFIDDDIETHVRARMVAEERDWRTAQESVVVEELDQESGLPYFFIEVDGILIMISIGNEIRTFEGGHVLVCREGPQNLFLKVKPDGLHEAKEFQERQSLIS